ncbi:PREDICTED: probable leucine-rich repeat receptor-like protein kinase At1g68400 [Nelumbo nucifera]|uniref:Probable leucine-rich repeat receptor-like protein kinase At1g68400 n=1 Tax=Nelumbo nucifera TaxID=4432 RepID=A0A1U8AIW8_NELNU|nr:PREDICTED: probable leucine-rich repeat receptor-like protein kinase At1g68400 [Nelumbo nucifera]
MKLSTEFGVFILFFSVSFCCIPASSPDFDALFAFKFASDPSNSLSSWSNSSHPCSGSWVGVTCSKNNHRVTRLVLEDLNLTGSIQILTHLTRLRLLSLKNNALSSSSLNFSSWTNMKLLFLSHNHFFGDFPAGISQLRRLRRLDLSHNGFSGHIPMTELNQLSHLLTLRLEANSFTGTLSSLDVPVADFNVSGNNLSGQIPTSLSSFAESSFTGNKNLCGKPLPYKCLNRMVLSDPVPVRASERHGKKLSLRVVLVIVIVDVSVVIAMIGVFYCYWKRRTKHHQTGLGGKRPKEMKRYGYEERYRGGRENDEEEMVFFEGCKQGLRVDDLLKSSAEMLGKGILGTTYKVVMDGGDVFVVKRTRERGIRKEFDIFLREIGGLRHSNIVSLRAYFSSEEVLLLVYDYLPNGSLYSLLHGNRGPGRTPLDWMTRLKLASDSAKGLAFLHSECKSKLPHGHLTSSNIVIDQAGNACISDFALHQLFLSPLTSNGAYKAPELMLNYSQRKFTSKSDVYSFGVILLEILTGKMATGEGETSLPMWVQRVVREEWTSEVFDIELLRYKGSEEEMMALLQVALLCLAQTPQDRPKMSVVHEMIEDIRTRECRQGGNHSPLNDLSSDSSPSPSEDTPSFTSS